MHLCCSCCFILNGGDLTEEFAGMFEVATKDMLLCLAGYAYAEEHFSVVKMVTRTIPFVSALTPVWN